jgi:heptosyltransferase II
MATPAVRQIRKFFPKSQITLLVHPRLEGFWSAFRGMDRVMSFSPKGARGFWDTVSALRGEGFDAALTFPSSLSSAFQLFAAQIPVRAGWSAEGRDPFLTHSIAHEQDRKIHLVWDYLGLAQRAFNRPLGKSPFLLEAGIDSMAKRKAVQLCKGTKGVIALAPGAAYGPAKRWPLEHWKDLVGLLLNKRKETLVILGGEEEKHDFLPLWNGMKKEDFNRVLDLTGKTDIPVLTALLSQCRLLVTNDSGPMHLAAAVQTPVVALFGSTSPHWTGPLGKGHSLIYKNLDCSPCFQKTCPIGYPCLKGITVDEVFQGIESRLSKKVGVTGIVSTMGVRN